MRDQSQIQIRYCLKHFVSWAQRVDDLKNKYDWMLKPVIVYVSVNRLIEVFEKKNVWPTKQMRPVRYSNRSRHHST